MGSKPQQPEIRRGGRNPTDQDDAQGKASPNPPPRGRPEGVGRRGRKGGGRGGGVPPEQRPPYPA